jgi:hypothetical protein
LPAHDQWVRETELHAPDLVRQYQEGLGIPETRQDWSRPSVQQLQNQIPSAEMTWTQPGPIAKQVQKGVSAKMT